MGKFDVLKIVRPIRLCEYAEEYGDAVIHVWVNPPQPMLAMHDALVFESGMLRRRLTPPPMPEPGPEEDGEGKPAAEAAPQLSEEETKAGLQRLMEIAEAHFEWFAKLWSQGPEGTQWTKEEVGQLLDGFAETDPHFWEWVTGRTVDMIREHRTGQKKA